MSIKVNDTNMSWYSTPSLYMQQVLYELNRHAILHINRIIQSVAYLFFFHGFFSYKRDMCVWQEKASVTNVTCQKLDVFYAYYRTLLSF